MIRQNHDLTVSDIRANYRDYLAGKFPVLSKAGKIIDLDLVHPVFSTQYAALLDSFDTVIALNVVEHIEDDTTAIANCRKLLKPGGTLVILVPAYQSLYNQLDKELYHYRRYTKSSLEKLFIKNNFSITRSFYFNAGGIPAWFLSGKIQKNKTIPDGQMKIFNALVPFFRLLDKVLRKTIGLSVITIGRKV